MVKNSDKVALPHERLRQARKERGLRQVDAADLLGVAESTYRNYESGKNDPQGLTWEDAIEAIKERQPIAKDSGEGDPLYDVTASMGDGSYEVNEQKIGYITGEQALGRPGRDVFWVFVRGDSMGERYRKHSMVPCLRFEESLKDIREDDVYLFRLEGAIQIKRLQRLPGQRIRIISDNPAYQDVELQLDDGIDFEVIGRVLV